MTDPDMNSDTRSSTSDASSPAATHTHSDPAGRTPDLALMHERAARVRAEAQVCSRDQVLSVASHDLRGPLNAIHTWAHVLERKLGEADPSIGRAIAGIRAGVEQQVSMIEKIIDTPRMATRHLAITRHPADLRAIIDDVIANARVTQGAGEITLEWRGEAHDAQVDAERLWQAWWCMLAYAGELSSAAHAAGVPSGARALRIAIEQGNCVTTLVCASLPVERAEFEQHVALSRRVAQSHGGQCTADPHGEAGECTMVMVFPLTSRG